MYITSPLEVGLTAAPKVSMGVVSVAPDAIQGELLVQAAKARSGDTNRTASNRARLMRATLEVEERTMDFAGMESSVRAEAVASCDDSESS